MAIGESLQTETVLAIKRTTRGLGFAVFDGPQEPFDWGVKELKRSGRSTVDVVRGMLDFYEPSILVVVNANVGDSRQRARVAKLMEEIQTEAEVRRIGVHAYSRSQIRNLFELFGATTRFEIAKKISEWLPQFEEAVPKFRKPWMSEGYRMAMFDALSLVMTYYYFEAE